MSKHTPGPWTVEPDPDNYGCYRIAEIAQEQKDWVSKEQVGEEFTERDKANACLMAAAPELLDALHDLTALYASTKGADPTFIDKARAAIAKAKGETTK